MLKLTHLLTVISIVAACYSSFMDIDQAMKFEDWFGQKQQLNAQKEYLILVKAKDGVQS